MKENHFFSNLFGGSSGTVGLNTPNLYARTYLYAGIPIVACEFKVVLYSVYQDFISNSRYLDILTSISLPYIQF